MKTWHIKESEKFWKQMITIPMYFYNNFEECVVRTKPSKSGDIEYYIKYKGELEFITDMYNTNAFETVRIDRITIKKKDYDIY